MALWLWRNKQSKQNGNEEVERLVVWRVQRPQLHGDTWWIRGACGILMSLWMAGGRLYRQGHEMTLSWFLMNAVAAETRDAVSPMQSQASCWNRTNVFLTQTHKMSGAANLPGTDTIIYSSCHTALCELKLYCFSTIHAKTSLFLHVIYSSADPHCHQCGSVEE